MTVRTGRGGSFFCPTLFWSRALRGGVRVACPRLRCAHVDRSAVQDVQTVFGRRPGRFLASKSSFSMRDFLSTKNRIHVQNPCTSGTEFWEVTFIEESAPNSIATRYFVPRFGGLTSNLWPPWHAAFSCSQYFLVGVSSVADARSIDVWSDRPTCFHWKHFSGYTGGF